MTPGGRRAALIVADQSSRGALAGARALALAGWDVGIATSVRSGALGASSSVRRRHFAPSPTAGNDRYIAAIAKAVDDGAYDVVFGAADAEVVTLSRFRESLGAVVASAPDDVIVAAFDKKRMSEAAVLAGLAVPQEIDWRSVPLRSLPYPVIVKPRRQWDPEGMGSATKLLARLVRDESETQSALATLEAAKAQPIVQEVIDGHNMSFVALVDRAGSYVATGQHVTLTTWPVAVGSTARAVAVPVDDGLAIAVLRLLRNLRWWGLVELEFRVDHDGKASFIDFNGRFYESMALELRTVGNFADALGRLALGQEVAALPARDPAGRQFQWLEADVAATLERTRKVPALDRARALLGCAARSTRSVHPYFDRRDLRPTLRRAAYLALRPLETRLGRARLTPHL